jgi:hypothetical protein
VSSTIFARMENLVDYEHDDSAFDDPIEVYHEVLSPLTCCHCRSGDAGLPGRALGALPPPAYPVSSSSPTHRFLHIVLPAALLMPVRRSCSHVRVVCDPSFAVKAGM